VDAAKSALLLGRARTPILAAAPAHTGAGRAFLLTLACEGGLPLNLVHKEGAKLRSFFKALLEEFQLYRRAGLSPEQLAENVRNRLPKSLRQPVVYALSGQLVDAIWKLQAQVGGSSTPLRIWIA
jgi:hypothetical protein